jgi:hypothetical protein
MKGIAFNESASFSIFDFPSLRIRPQAERYNARNAAQRQLKKPKSGQRSGQKVELNKCLPS